jgi:alanyl-tRNA synthetase
LAGMVDVFVEKAIAEATAASGEKLVMRFDFGTDGKIAKSISTSFCKKVKDKALLLVSVDTEADKCLIMSCCPKGVGVDCKAWVTAATDGLDAKGGGGKELATFQLVGASHADTIVANASK